MKDDMSVMNRVSSRVSSTLARITLSGVLVVTSAIGLAGIRVAAPVETGFVQQAQAKTVKAKGWYGTRLTMYGESYSSMKLPGTCHVRIKGNKLILSGEVIKTSTARRAKALRGKFRKAGRRVFRISPRCAFRIRTLETGGHVRAVGKKKIREQVEYGSTSHFAEDIAFKVSGGKVRSIFVQQTAVE